MINVNKMDGDNETPSDSTKPKCHLCDGSSLTVECDDCSNLLFCEECDGMYHSHHRRLNHKRKPWTFVSLDEKKTQSAEEKPNSLIDEHQVTALCSIQYPTYPCGCLQQWIGPDVKGRLIPALQCLVHNPSSSIYPGSKQQRNPPSLNSPNVPCPKGKDAGDEGPNTDSSDGSWTCGHCTFENSLDEKICKVCCKTHGILEEKSPAKVGKNLETTGKPSTTGDYSDDWPVPSTTRRKDYRPGDDWTNRSTKIQENYNESTYEERKYETYPEHNVWVGDGPTRTHKEDEKLYRTGLTNSPESQRNKHHQKQYKHNTESSESSRGKHHDFVKVNQEAVKTEDSGGKGFRAKVIDFFLSNKQSASDNVNGNQFKHKKTSIAKWIKDAEKFGFNMSDLTVAVAYAPDNPIQWLDDNWDHVINKVINSATNYGCELKINNVGILTSKEAKSAMYLHKNVAEAVNECIKRRQEAFKKLEESGDFRASKITDAISQCEGDIQAAYDYLVSMCIKSDNARQGDPRDLWVRNGHRDRLSTSSPGHGYTSTGNKCYTPQNLKNVDNDGTPMATSASHYQGSQKLADPEDNFYDAEMPPEDSGEDNVMRFINDGLTSLPQFKDEVRKLARKYMSEQDQNKIDSSDSKATSVDSSGPKTYSMPEVSKADKKKRIRRFIADELVSTQKQAEIASFLIDLTFDESDAIEAAKTCDTVDIAISYLQQICELCTKQFPMHKMFSMLNCPHRCCLNCASSHFKKVIVNSDILNAVCPICHEPKLTDEKTAAEYFNNLEIFLNNLLDDECNKLLRKKLRNRAAVIDSTKNNAQKKLCRRLIAEGIFSEPRKAEVASQLLSLNIDESDSFAAAKECSSVDTALTYLQLQECPICATEIYAGKMITMLNCADRICPECTKIHFSIIIKERNIMDALCPCCDEPNLDDNEVANQYFSNLQMMLKNLIDAEDYKLFDQKLRDRALMLDPNFCWCQKCLSGFFADHNQMKTTCPHCKITFCIKCKKEWEDQHQDRTCQQFIQWKLDNDPEYQYAGLEKHLAEYGIDCPRCKFKYELAKGGCIHFRCIQCRHEFCSGCGGTFQKEESCKVSPNCKGMGFHAHHPRNCLFYLRDWGIKNLLQLLKENNVKYDISRGNDGSAQPKTCPVMEQKEMPNGAMEDAMCGKEVKEECSGLCKSHFVEYLVSVINKNDVDPVNMMNVFELQQELKRNDKEFAVEDDSEEYRARLRQLILKEIPLRLTNVLAEIKPNKA